METLYRRPINIQAFLLHLIYTKEVKLSCGIAHNIMHRVFILRSSEARNNILLPILSIEATYMYNNNRISINYAHE